jgi:hypothetical protein
MEAAKAGGGVYLIVFLPLLCNRLLKIIALTKRGPSRPHCFAKTSMTIQMFRGAGGAATIPIMGGEDPAIIAFR